MVAILGSQAHNVSATHGAVFFLFLYHFSYIIGFGSLPYLYATEIAPLHLRTIINSVSISMSWLVSILVVDIAPTAFDILGQRFFLVFAGLNAAMAPAIYYLFPETAGRCLEEVDEIFASSDGVLDVVCNARRLSRRCFGEVQSQKIVAAKLDDTAALV